MDSIKGRNGMDLTEEEDIKKRWKEYTEELYKKIFMTKIIMMVIYLCDHQLHRARLPGMWS